MKQLLTFIRKEFYHVLRDRRVLLMLFGLPIVQVILFGFALSTEIKNTGIAVFDQDKSAISSALVSKINTNKYFDIDRNLNNSNQFQEAFKDGKVKFFSQFQYFSRGGRNIGTDIENQSGDISA